MPEPNEEKHTMFREPAPSHPPQLLFTRKHAAHILALSLRKVDYLIAEGTLKVRRVNGSVRIHIDTLKAFAKGVQ